jgi:hypothetical protein
MPLPGETRRDAVARTLAHFPIRCLALQKRDAFGGNAIFDKPVVFNALADIPLYDVQFSLPHQWIIKFE